MSERPRVFVARRIPDEGLDADRRGLRRWTSGRTSCRRRATSCCGAIAGCDGVLTLLTDRVDDEFLDAAGPGLRVVSNYAVGFDNIDVAACAAARRRGRQHAGRPDRDDRRPRLGAADGRRPPASRGRPLRPRRPAGRRGVRCCCSGPTSTARRSGSSASAGSARRWHDGRRASGCGSCTTTSSELPDDVTGPLGATYVPLEELLAAERLRVAPRQPEPGDAPPDQRANRWAG